MNKYKIIHSNQLQFNYLIQKNKKYMIKYNNNISHQVNKVKKVTKNMELKICLELVIQILVNHKN